MSESTDHHPGTYRRATLAAALLVILSIAPPTRAQDAGASALELAGVGADAWSATAPGPGRIRSSQLLRDAWSWQHERYAVAYGTLDVPALTAAVGPGLTADIVGGLLKVAQPDDLSRISRVTSRSVFSTLKNPEVFLVIDTSLTAGRLASLVGAQVGATPETFVQGNREYSWLPLSQTHAVTAVALLPGRVQIAYHPADGEVSLLESEAPMGGVQARSLDETAILSVRIVNPKALPDISTGGFGSVVQDGVKNMIKNGLVGNVDVLAADVRRPSPGLLSLGMRLTPSPGYAPADLVRRYETLRRTAGIASGQVKALLERLRFTPAGRDVLVEMTATPAEFEPLLRRLAQGQLPWS